MSHYLSSIEQYLQVLAYNLEYLYTYIQNTYLVKQIKLVPIGVLKKLDSFLSARK